MARKQLILEQINAGEIPANEYKEADRNERLSELKASDREILSKYSADDMQKLVAAKLAARATAPRQADFADAALNAAERKPQEVRVVHFPTQRIMKFAAAAAVLCLAVMIPLFVKNSGAAAGTDAAAAAGVTLEAASSTERAKGVGPRMHIYRKEGDAAVRLENRTHVEEGDILQISYVASGAKYGFILSIDGNGCVSQHYPDYGDAAAPLSSEGEIALDFSYRLDDAPSFERFLLITADSQFSIREVEQAVSSFQNADRAMTEDFSNYVPKNADITDILLLK
ncbi:MAG: hypothetical protein KBT02_02045 [Treponema sp.]|nr:hypothetical protein [Candidatus Treponema caballi]